MDQFKFGFVFLRFPVQYASFIFEIFIVEGVSGT